MFNFNPNTQCSFPNHTANNNNHSSSSDHHHSNHQHHSHHHNHNLKQTSSSGSSTKKLSPLVESSVKLSPPTSTSTSTSSSSSTPTIKPSTSNQASYNSSTHSNQNIKTHSPITIHSPSTPSTSNLKFNLDQFKNHHRHHHHDPNHHNHHHHHHHLVDHQTTTPTTNEPIDQDCSPHHFLQPSVSSLSAPNIHPNSHHLTNQLNHPQPDTIHLQFNPSSEFHRDKKVLKDIKRRTTKACDNCRKSKCKCTRAPDSNGLIPNTGPCQNCQTNSVECTFNGTSRKRGPPKGYIEAIESRLHRMEALLGGLLESDDPRAQALFSELIGDSELRDLLTTDLRIAAQQGTEGKPRKSWKPSDPTIPTSSASDCRTQLNLTDTQKVLWGVSHLNQTSCFENHRPQDPNLLNGQATDVDDDSECEGSQLDPSPPPPADDHIHLQHKNRRRRLESNMLSIHRSKFQVAGLNQSSSTTTIPHTGSATFTLSRPESSDPVVNTSQLTFECNNSLQSPDSNLPSAKQQSPATISELADVVGQLSLDENDEVRYHGRSSGLYLISASQRYKDFFWHFPKPGFWPVAPIHRSPTTSYILEVVNPLELLPSQETMTHLLDLYWEFVHPMMPILYKPEFVVQFRNLMANLDIVKSARPHWSLNQIWCHALFRNSSLNDESPGDPDEQLDQQDEQPEPPVSGLGPTNRISVLLLLVMFSISSRYSDCSQSAPTEGEYWKAGDNYLAKAKQMLNLDYGYSKLTNCQSLILMAYREIGAGAMAESWLYTGMAVRMAQDMGLFRDVDKWFMPVKKFTYEDKQIRKRVWWACVNMDKYVSTYIGRPMMIFERDYDTAFPSTDEPDEHELWKGCSPKRNETGPPLANPNPQNTVQDHPMHELAETKRADPIAVEQNSSKSDCPFQDPNETADQKIHTISCFNRAASLSVLISRIVANIYAIRIRVIGQSCETLLSLLDQNLARWYLDLPEQLHYKPQSIPRKQNELADNRQESNKRAPTPHVLTLHAQFYTALILLHRPFIPASRSQDNSERSSTDAPPLHPSHSICTTAANAITNIAQAYHEAFGLRQAPAFLVYYIFTAAILHVNNARLEAGLALTAKSNLLKCMNSLREMAPTWTGAVRAWELLSGLVDLRDVDLQQYTQQSSNPNTSTIDGGQLKKAHSADRGLKRPASSGDLNHHLLHPRADQNNTHAFSSKPRLTGRKLPPTPAGTSTRLGLSKSINLSKPDSPRDKTKPIRSISTSDWCAMAMATSKNIRGNSVNPSDCGHAHDPAPLGHFVARSPDQLGTGIRPNDTFRCKMGSSKFPVTSGINPTLLSPTTGDQNMMDNRATLFGQADRPYSNEPLALPTTAMEELTGFVGSNRNFHQRFLETHGHQTLQQQQPPCQSNFNQVLSPLLFDFSSFNSSPIGNPSYESPNERQLPTTTIQGIFGLGGSSPMMGGVSDQAVVKDQENSLMYENQEDARASDERHTQHQGIKAGLLFPTEQATEEGSFSNLGINWFSSPVETINGFRIDPPSRAVLNPNSQADGSQPPAYYHHHTSLVSTDRGEQVFNNSNHF